MKKYIFLFATLFFSFSLWAQNVNELKVPLANPGQKGKLKIEIKAGMIEVKGTARQDVLIHYTNREDGKLKVEDTKGGMKKISGGIPGLEISARENNVYLEADNWQKAVDVTVEVPKNFDLELGTFNKGEIKVENITGEVVLESYNGPITAQNIAGSLVANTYNGDIRVTFSKITPETPMAFSTYVGEVDITLPASTKASFKMKAESGDIYTDFDMKLEAPKPSTKTDKRKSGFTTLIDGWITGQINGGGPEFRIENHYGDVYIRKD